jgi:hypothetical protein
VLYLLIKAAVSGAIVAAVSEIARRYPGWGGLVASPQGPFNSINKLSLSRVHQQ